MTSDTEIFGTSNKICTTVVLNLQNRALIDVKCNRSLQQRTYRNANGTHDQLIAMAWLFKRPIYQSQRSSANIVVLSIAPHKLFATYSGTFKGKSPAYRRPTTAYIELFHVKLSNGIKKHTHHFNSSRGFCCYYIFLSTEEKCVYYVAYKFRR